jgi:excisionase family DNA binding protein
METIERRLAAIEKAIGDIAIAAKEILTIDEASAYLGIAKSTLYNFTSTRKVPHYKLNGKSCYFRRSELDAWILQNRVSTDAELEMHAQSICMRTKNY